MTLYDLLRQISHIITPDSDEFFNYVINTSDNNGGFLRTCYCWRKNVIANIDLGTRKYRTVLVTMQRPINETDLYQRPFTELKIQIDYMNTDSVFEDAVWDAQLGYNYVYLVDLTNKCFEMRYMETPV